MRLLSVTFITASLLLGASPLLADNIERSCDIRYRLHLGQIQGVTNVRLVSIADFIATPRAADGLHELWTFTARRGCGRTVPNRCRERASEAAMACMVSHGQSPANKPDACTKDGVKDYPFDNLERTIRQHVCNWAAKNDRFNETILPRPYHVNVDLQAVINGDTGCGGPGKSIITRSVYRTEVSCPIE